MNFIHDDFMLHNEISKQLYHEVSKDQKIIDYHCHLDPKMIAENKEFNDITEIWLLGDHYKWRAMRANGIDEKYITGDSTNKEKFEAWAKTLESCVGNPLYHWSAIELKRYFDIDELLNEDNWEQIWEKANKVIKDRKYTPKSIIEMSNVTYVCTTDGPNDDLRYHEMIKEDKNFKTMVTPGFRPDEMFALNTPKFYNFFEKLQENVNKVISSYDDFIAAVYERIDYFAKKGCTISDHGLENLYFVKYTKEEINKIFDKVLRKETVTNEEFKKYLSSVFVDLGKKYVKLNWVMQIHYGAIRNNDELIFNTIGPDAGTDSMKDQDDIAKNLNLMLSTLKLNKALPKLIIYNLEPSQNHLVACTLANFSSNLEHKAQLQYGSGWWFNDTKEGMLRQLKALADQGLLMNFVGMLTDSRSFVSYIRHEYFRRILCQYIGDLVVKGEIPNDKKLLTKLIKNISHDNALRYFALERD